MPSRGFILLSATLLGATALLLWFGFSRPLARAPAPERASLELAEVDRALGVAAADYDPASRDSASHDPALAVSRDAPSPLVAARTRAPAVLPAPPRTAPVEDPPGPPLAGTPEMNALSEASAAVQPRVLAAVRADLERRRDDLRERCWPPGSKVAATFAVQATYAADGTLLALAVPDVFGLPGVGTCLMEQIGQTPPALPEPPGVDVAVTVPLAFAGTQPASPRPSATALDRGA